ncbi:Flagellin N-methylase [Anaerohalosphaera lusitana]|uniref:Flagellin N-methylase n=1 Tax=Anaerohalosphaera lusitana TaxID=1936003 RepID=A0A1U9NID4_9BACT|nr:YkgJ family cysteine cluster protein [Anaerohalosphaera lusitana]AQT67508.1 Flagellin N-methylase [Anaerohalosphaera lusitana]
MNYDELEKLAGQKEDENWAFRSFLKFYDDLTDQQIDRLVHELTDSVAADIDCTKCGRCCKQLKPTLTTNDQKRLAKALNITSSQLQQSYLEYVQDEESNCWQMKKTSCPFLKNRKCIAYESRPQDCRNYPYLKKPDFTMRTIAMLDRTRTCPIVFEVIEQLKEHLAFDAGNSAGNIW